MYALRIHALKARMHISMERDVVTRLGTEFNSYLCMQDLYYDCFTCESDVKNRRQITMSELFHSPSIHSSRCYLLRGLPEFAGRCAGDSLRHLVAAAAAWGFAYAWAVDHLISGLLVY